MSSCLWSLLFHKLSVSLCPYCLWYCHSRSWHLTPKPPPSRMTSSLLSRSLSLFISLSLSSPMQHPPRHLVRQPLLPALLSGVLPPAVPSLRCAPAQTSTSTYAYTSQSFSRFPISSISTPPCLSHTSVSLVLPPLQHTLSNDIKSLQLPQSTVSPLSFSLPE